MATAKKPAKKKATTKRKTTPKRKTATKRKRSLSGTPKPKATKTRAAASPKQKAARKGFAAATELAVEAIYEAGAAGKAKPTWGKALRAAYGSGTLSGTAARRPRKTTKK